MAAEGDPYGYRALAQRHAKEARCAIAHHQARKAGGAVPLDPLQSFSVVNPLTHRDHLIRLAPEAGSLPPAAGKAPSASVASSSRRSVRSVGGTSAGGASSMVPPSTAASARDDAMLKKLQQLESTLAEERKGRLTIQAELARLQALLEAQLGGDAVAAASRSA